MRLNQKAPQNFEAYRHLNPGSPGFSGGSVIWDPGFNPPHVLLHIKGTNPKRVKVTWLVSQNSPSYEFTSEIRSKSLSQSLFQQRHITNGKSQMIVLGRTLLHEVLFWGFWALDILKPFYFHFGFL